MLSKLAVDYLKPSERIFPFTRVRDVLVIGRTKVSLKLGGCEVRVVINVTNMAKCVMRPLLNSFVM